MSLENRFDARVIQLPSDPNGIMREHQHEQDQGCVLQQWVIHGFATLLMIAARCSQDAHELMHVKRAKSALCERTRTI